MTNQTIGVSLIQVIKAISELSAPEIRKEKTEIKGTETGKGIEVDPTTMTIDKGIKDVGAGVYNGISSSK